jgi:hypothetical protein
MGRTSCLRVVATVALVAGVTAACSTPTPKAPEGTDSPATKALVGGEPDFAFVMRLDRLRADPVYAPIVRDLSQKEDLEQLLQGITTIDAVGSFEGQDFFQVSLVAAVRSAPPYDMMPKEWQKKLSGKDGGHVLASGVWEYASIGEGGWPYGLYVAPHDWVLLAGRAAGKGHDYFSANGSPPPPVDFGDDSLAGLWIGPTAMKNPAMNKAANEPGSKGLESSRIVLRDGSHGDMLFTLVYDTKAHADEALKVTSDAIGSYASVWKSLLTDCPGLGVLGLENESDGRVVKAKVTHIPEAIRAAMACSKKDTNANEPPPPGMPPPPPPPTTM